MCSLRKLVLNEHNVYLLWKELPDIPYYERYSKQHYYGRKLLSFALKELFNIDFNESMLGFNKYLKPYLIDFPEIHFNLSHSNSMVVLVISNVEVGVDIEDITHFSESFINKVFTSDEQNVIDENISIDEHYTQLWTIKESYFKCLGTGLDFPLTKISFCLNHQSYPIQFRKDNSWYYQERLGDSIISVCLSGV